MPSSFWKAAGISVAAFAAALLSGFVVDFRLALFLIVAIQLTWTLFCLCRVVGLYIERSRRDRPPYDREGYWFALGGATTSIGLLLAAVVLSQAV